jgi:hypothetical protein
MTYRITRSLASRWEAVAWADDEVLPTAVTNLADMLLLFSKNWAAEAAYSSALCITTDDHVRGEITLGLAKAQ